MTGGLVVVGVLGALALFGRVTWRIVENANRRRAIAADPYHGESLGIGS